MTKTDNIFVPVIENLTQKQIHKTISYFLLDSVETLSQAP